MTSNAVRRKQSRAYALQHSIRQGHPIPPNIVHNGDMKVPANGDAVLPPRLHVTKSLYLRACSALRTIPADLRVGGILNVMDCPNLEEIPATVAIGGWVMTTLVRVKGDQVLVTTLLPDTVMGAIIGRQFHEVVEHRLFPKGSLLGNAIILEASRGEHGWLWLTVDRAPFAPYRRDIGWEYDDPDDTPLDQDDQSWRDLTDDDIAAIRAIPDPSDHAAR